MVTQQYTHNERRPVVVKLIAVLGIVLATSLVPSVPNNDDGFYFWDSHEDTNGAWMFCPAPLTATDCNVPTL